MINNFKKLNSVIAGSIFLLTSCHSVNSGAPIDDDIHYKIISEIESKEDKKGYQHYDSIDKIMPIAIDIMKDNNRFVTEAHKLGRYDPFSPKAGKMMMFPFHNLSINVTVHLEKETDDIEAIYIYKPKQKIKTEDLEITNWNLQYVDTISKLTPYSGDIKEYAVSYLYQVKDKNTIMVKFMVNNLSKEQADLLVTQKLPPDLVTVVDLYYKNN